MRYSYLKFQKIIINPSTIFVKPFIYLLYLVYVSSEALSEPPLIAYVE